MNIPGLTKTLLVITLVFCIGHRAAAQSADEDTALYKHATAHLIDLYHQSSGDQAGIYNGSQYGGYAFQFATGHPFFYDDKPAAASVVYDGVLYENIVAQFDEVQELFIMRDSVHNIQLLNDRVEKFSLSGSNFIRLVKDSQNTALAHTGFYNVLYQGGAVTLLKREEKTIREDVSSGEIRRLVDVATYYFIKKNEKFYGIKSKSGVLDLFNDRKKEIRQYMGSNNLSYRKDKENTLVKITAYYDQLTK